MRLCSVTVRSVWRHCSVTICSEWHHCSVTKHSVWHSSVTMHSVCHHCSITIHSVWHHSSIAGLCVCVCFSSGPIEFVEPDLSSLPSPSTRPMSPEPGAGDKRDSLTEKQKQGRWCSLTLTWPPAARSRHSMDIFSLSVFAVVNSTPWLLTYWCRSG